MNLSILVFQCSLGFESCCFCLMKSSEWQGYGDVRIRISPEILESRCFGILRAISAHVGKGKEKYLIWRSRFSRVRSKKEVGFGGLELAPGTP